MKLDCVKCNKCGKVHSVSRGCEPLSSDAVLAEVRVLQEEAKIMSEVHPSKDARFFAGCVYKFFDEHFR